MANVKNINGYDIKDAVAREDIATLNNEINNETTGLAKQVSDLDTQINDSTDGIETKVTNLQNSLPDLTNVFNFDETDLTGDTSVIDEFYNGTIAWNENSKWFKFFMYFKVSTTPSVEHKYITLPLPTGFTVTENYFIRNTLHIYKEDGTLEGLQGLTLSSSGIEVVVPKHLNGTFLYNVEPYLYYNGVLEEPES